MKRLHLIALIVFLAAFLISCDSDPEDNSKNPSNPTGKIASVSNTSELKAALKNSSIGTIQVKSGSYDDEYTIDRKIVLEAEKNVMIKDLTVNADGTKIMSPTISRLTASSKIGEGSLLLENVNVTDEAILDGGGRNSIKISGNSVFEGNLIINKAGLGFKLDQNVTINSSVQINQAIYIEPLAAGNIPVISGEVTINADNVYINIKIGNLKFDMSVTTAKLGAYAEIDESKFVNINFEKPKETNLALSGTASSSSNESTTYTPEKAIDNNSKSTYWASGRDFKTPQWLQIDLGTSKRVSKITLVFEAGSSDYDLQYSLDGKNWSDIAVRKSTKTWTSETFSDLNVNGRYFRMSARNTLGTAGVALYEFQIFGYE